MKRTIVVSRALLIGVTLFGALAAGAVIGLRLLQPTAVEAEGDPGQVAVDFVRAFYSVDYRDRQAWLDGLRPLATTEGHQLLEQGLAVVLWPQLMQAQTIVLGEQVSAADGGLALQGASQVDGGSAWQVRSVAVTLAPEAVWPGMRRNSFTTYVMLRLEAGQWKFALFLSEPQVNELRRSAQSQP